MWEIPHFPTYFVPRADVSSDVLVATSDPSVFDVVVGDRVATGAAHVDGEYVRLDWDAMDAWYEEDEEVFVHPRDPHSRVDALAIDPSRRRRGRGQGRRRQPLAGDPLRDRPPAAVLPAGQRRADGPAHARPTPSPGAPYKGNARYWSLEVGGRVRKNFVWGYEFPTRESWPIAGMLCFYNERVDLIIDGVRHERPKTKFS